MTFSFSRTYWGGLPHFQIPYQIAKDDVLTLTPTALALLLVLYQSARAAQYRQREAGDDIAVKITQKRISERVGRSANQISTAATELKDSGLIRLERPRKKYGEFGANEYTLCNPATQQPLSSGSTNILDHNDVRYFLMPNCVVKDHDAVWSIANMRGSELKVYVAACWLASKKRAGRFAVTINQLKKVSGLSTLATTEKALAGVLDKALLGYGDEEMVLHDPYTGQPPHFQTSNSEDDPANYKYGDGSVRWNANT